MHFPNPERQVAHISLKVVGNLLQKRVIGHASFPVASAIGTVRKDLAIILTSFDDKPGGRIVLKIRVQPMGVVIEDWVALGQGLPSLSDVPPMRSGGGLSLTPVLSKLPRGRSPEPEPVRSSSQRHMRARVKHAPRQLGSPETKADTSYVEHMNPLMNIVQAGESKPLHVPGDDETALPGTTEHESFYTNPMTIAADRAARTVHQANTVRLTDDDSGFVDEAHSADLVARVIEGPANNHAKLTSDSGHVSHGRRVSFSDTVTAKGVNSHH